jgi:hypothetical protein
MFCCRSSRRRASSARFPASARFDETKPLTLPAVSERIVSRRTKRHTPRRPLGWTWETRIERADFGFGGGVPKPWTGVRRWPDAPGRQRSGQPRLSTWEDMNYRRVAVGRGVMLHETKGLQTAEELRRAAGDPTTGRRHICHLRFVPGAILPMMPASSAATDGRDMPKSGHDPTGRL